MTYITAAQLQSAMGTRDYNMTLSLDGGTTADSATVTAILTRCDARIDRYNTRFSTAYKAELAYSVAVFLAYERRGPGNVPGFIRENYQEAIDELRRHQGLTARPCYDPMEEPNDDYLSDLIADPVV